MMCKMIKQDLLIEFKRTKITREDLLRFSMVGLFAIALGAFFSFFRIDPFFTSLVPFKKCIFLVSFPLCSISAFYVFERMGLGSGSNMSGVLSVLYVLFPYHWTRFNQFSLPLYFWVPLQVLTLVWLYSSRPLFFKKSGHGKFDFEWRTKKTVLASGIALISGLLSADYAFFYIFFCWAAGGVACIYRRSRYPFLVSLILTFLVFVPFELKRYCKVHFEHEIPAAFSQRDSETYGLRLAPLLLPSANHPFRAFRNARAQYQPIFPGIEGSSDTLGLVGVLGFFIILAQILRRGKRSTLPQKIAPLLYVALLFALCGGLGSIFALIFVPSIPYWNRIYVFLVFFSFVGFASGWKSFIQWLQDYLGKESWVCQKLEIGGPIFIFLFGLIDQMGI